MNFYYFECITVPQTRGHVLVPRIAPTSDEYVLDQLSTVEEKLLKLLEELDGKNLPEILKQMEEEEVSFFLIFFFSLSVRLLLGVADLVDDCCWGYGKQQLLLHIYK